GQSTAFPRDPSKIKAIDVRLCALAQCPNAALISSAADRTQQPENRKRAKTNADGSGTAATFGSRGGSS
ncbi:MAG: hypothetical protein P8N76_28540, partial [Pirellulaceae bacterium]|nr:hypothetical protein [Pirellulaceae bacterium]